MKPKGAVRAPDHADDRNAARAADLGAGVAGPPPPAARPTVTATVTGPRQDDLAALAAALRALAPSSPDPASLLTAAAVLESSAWGQTAIGDAGRRAAP